MCADRLEFFGCPAYKLMISDLKSAIPNNLATSVGVNEARDQLENEWSVTITHIPDDNGKMVPLTSFIKSKPSLKLNIKLFWIQGKVKEFLKMSEDSDNLSLVIADNLEETDRAVLYEYNTVPGGDHPDIKVGSYVGALGQIGSNSGSGSELVVKVAKIMYLGDKPILKTLWKDEVRLAKSFLAGLISSSI